MSTIKSYTDLEQSKKLAEILPIESADMNYWCGTQIRIGGHRTMDKDLDVPCWSLSVLLSILPVTTTLLKDGNISDTGDVKYSCECSMVSIHKWFDNPIDACVEVILKLNENKLI